MKKNFEKAIIIVEGNSDREINDNALKATIATLVANYGLSIVSTKNISDTARLIYWTAKKEQQENKRSPTFKIGRKPKETKRFQEELVATLPGISSVLSKKLLKHFGSVEKIFTATEKELSQVNGINSKVAKRIKELISKKY